MLNDIKQEADKLPLAYCEKVLRQVVQLEEGQRIGLDVSEAARSLGQEVARIKERLGLDAKPEVHGVHLVKITTPWGEGQVDEVRRKVTVGGVEFAEREINILHDKGLDRQVLNFIIGAKREFGGEVIKCR